MSAHTAARERPIIMSGESVRAILDERKTQTRRVVVPQPPSWAMQAMGRVGEWQSFEGEHPLGACESAKCAHLPGPGMWTVRNRYGNPGDRLWVRETWHCPKQIGGSYHREKRIYRADASLPWRDYSQVKWSSPIHMPRWASRLTLEVLDVRVERVRDIPPADTEREGLIDLATFSYDARVTKFGLLWDTINGKRAGGAYAWDRNPWVFVIKFKRVAP